MNAYVAVAVNISARFAVLINARMKANTAVNTAARTILRLVLCSWLRAKIARTGRIDDKVVAMMLLALTILDSS